MDIFLTYMCDPKCRQTYKKRWRIGGGVTRAPKSNVFIFMQFSAKIMLNNRLAPPPPNLPWDWRTIQGNPGPATEKD